MKKAIVVGSGAGGCMAAREIALRGYEVTVFEAGHDFRPLELDLQRLEFARKAGLFLDERMIELLFPAMRIQKGQVGLVHVTGRAVGGTTTLATGNALRYDRYLTNLGIDLNEEFAELEREVPQTTEHRANWSALTERLFATFEQLGLAPQVTPKFMEDPTRCVTCGKCVLGCRYGAKWTCDQLLVGLDGVTVKRGAKVERVITENGKATGVVVQRGPRRETHPADLVILAAGGLGTPVVLEASGIPTRPTLFVDPVLCIACRWEGAHLDTQLPMPFVSEQPDYILSPYFDWLSFFFNGKWRRPAHDIMSIMIKYKDSSAGFYNGTMLDKPVTPHDQDVIERSVEEATRVLEHMGISRADVFLGTLNA